jgi:hypothetical protein
MKYVSPKYESFALEVNDIIMSGEGNFTISESKDEIGNKIGDISISAGSIFAPYFD